MDKPKDILLEGIAGSVAFGLATETSDIDTHGVYRAPLNDVLGLKGPKVVTESYTNTGPDIALHEVGKFISLALKCNPTVLETLWLPRYKILTADGASLIAHSKKFLYTRGVRNSYGGYATAQVKKLTNDPKPTAKWGRHAMRLLLQGQSLIESGDMDIDVGEQRDYLFQIGELAVRDTERFVYAFKQELARFDETPSVLPEEPDREFFEQLLVRIRLNGEGL